MRNGDLPLDSLQDGGGGESSAMEAQEALWAMGVKQVVGSPFGDRLACRVCAGARAMTPEHDTAETLALS